MSKNPAFLFYPGDWLGGTMTFTWHQKGAYMDLLMAQFNQFSLSIEDIRYILGIDFEVIWEVKLRSKFEIESDGKMFFNRRLREEMLRRKMFCESRRNNKQGKNQYKNKDKKRGHMTSHMLGHMKNTNATALHVHSNASIPDVFNTTILKRALGFNFEDIWSKYPIKDGKKAAEKHFRNTVKNEKDMDDIHIALNNYLKSERVEKGFIKNGSTWFNNWRDWIDFKEPVAAKDEENELLRKAGLINDTDSRTSNKRSFHEG